MISKAKTQGLLRSKRTQRNVDKLKLGMSSVDGKATEGKDFMAMLEKFMRKQGLKDVDEQSLAERKRVQIQDLIRSMQKDHDGPRLFLTVVVFYSPKQIQAWCMPLANSRQNCSSF